MPNAIAIRMANYRTAGIRYCASIRFGGRALQVNYSSPRELVRALRDMGASSTGGLVVLKLYIKGV